MSTDRTGAISPLDEIEGVVWEADPSTWRFRVVSQGAKGLLGFAPDRWLADADFWMAHLYEPDRDRTVGKRRNALAAAERYDDEYRMVAADGRIVWVKDRVQIVRDAARAPRALRGLTVETTGRRNMEEALRDSELRYRAFVEQSSEGIWRIRHDPPMSIDVPEDEQIERFYERGKMSECNLVMARMYGFERVDELVGKSLGELLPRDDPRNIEYLKEFIRSGYRLTNAESHEVDRFGNEKHFLNNLMGIVENGCLIDTWGTQRDVTTLRAAESEIRRQRDLYEAMLRAQSDIGVGLVISEDDRIVYANEAYQRIVAYTEDELREMKDFWRLIPSDESARLIDMHRRRAKGEQVDDHFETRLVRKDGSLVDVDIGVKTLNRTPGGAISTLTLVRDVTALSETRKLEEQLRQSQKMEAVGRLAGGIAHDFNNLLTAITGYSDLLMARLGHDDPLRRYVDEIRKSGLRAATLTRQLLAFSRKQILQPRALDLNSVVREMEGMLRRIIGENIELVVELAANIWAVRADPSQLEQVVMNLVVNARDAMPDGGMLSISTRNSPKDFDCAPGLTSPDDYVTITIRDTGSGIPPEAKAHLFEPFFTTKELGKGTGLGLSTVYGIVKQSGGHVCVQSELGRGSTFRVCLPREAEPAGG